jgi:hypothetical protein
MHTDDPITKTIEDAFVLAFHTRAIRGGKGERALFYKMMEELNAEHPTICRAVADLIPEFGSWRDVFVLADKFFGMTLCGVLLNLAATQLRNDSITKEGERISLCAKWAPREGKHGDGLARRLALLMFPDAPTTRMANYRHLVAGLNRRLSTVETLMSSGHWADIKPSAVPLRAGKLYKSAFLNIVKKGETVTSLRYPDNEDRMACRATFESYYARPCRSSDSLFMGDPQYDIIRERVRSTFLDI